MNGRVKKLSASKNIASATTSNPTHSRPTWRLPPPTAHNASAPRHAVATPQRLTTRLQQLKSHSAALRRWKNKINTRVSAQCYPRHACPLNVSLFMQVQQENRPAPALALHAINKYPDRMQSNAPDSCAAIFDTKSEKLAPKRPAKIHYSPLLSALRSSSTCCCINPMVLIL